MSTTMNGSDAGDHGGTAGHAASGWGALDGITVVDLSRVLGGPYCTQILADHGATVIKVEPPAGDETRSWGPPYLSEDVSWYFAGANRNKTSMTLDLRTDAGREALLGLLEGADVLVENFKPGSLTRWGLDPEEVLAARFPQLVHCSITGFGEDGPLGGLPGYDAIAQAMSGLMSVNGTPESGPVRIGMPVVDMVTGLNAANGILMALHERSAGGRGQRVETALFDCALSVMHPHLPNHFGTGRRPELTGNDHPNIAPYSTYRTGEGELFLAVGNDGQFARLCEVLERPDLPADPRFRGNPERTAHRAELRAELEAAFAGHAADPLAKTLMAAGVPAGPILAVDEVVAHPHTRHRGMIVEMEGGYRGVASPVRLSRTPPEYRMPPPRQGGDPSI
ncbi:CaiB/BaiF CoA transferase family protein [Brevibacterium album]|uniref:CaiB/BaiF CoA transferase family protein n=1 Tax=Brevibacterium album TaxID=417948 RepID=UPI00041FCDF0|nr:CoA transferase [Brevibacterium album]